jgi:enoyl-CoA hydratase
MDIGSLRRHLKLGPRMSRARQDMEQITLAAIEGFCIGGGVALAVALDFCIMASNAHICVPEIGLGMNMSWQSIPRLLHLMGPARTKQAVIMPIIGFPRRRLMTEVLLRNSRARESFRRGSGEG